MSVDVVVTATAFMDLTFIGLESVPRPGEERFAGDLIHSPGGGAINAIGAARLGLKAALSVPLGEDLDGRFIREALEAEGIALSTCAGTRTPTTVVMPWGGERAMVTYEPLASTSAAEVAGFEPRAVIVALEVARRMGGDLVRVPGFEMETVDTTGAGDLLCAAFVWADLSGADLELALRWAVLYGSLSVTVPTGAAGAVTLERLLEEGSARGLPPLATHKETPA